MAIQLPVMGIIGFIFNNSMRAAVKKYGKKAVDAALRKYDNRNSDLHAIRKVKNPTTKKPEAASKRKLSRFEKGLEEIKRARGNLN